jgi:hypothetical protein
VTALSYGAAVIRSVDELVRGGYKKSEASRHLEGADGAVQRDPPRNLVADGVAGVEPSSLG